MKNSKKLTAMTALAVVAATVVPAVASASTVTFTDISSSFAAQAIQDLANQGILNGTGNGMFNPKGNITRQDMAIVLAKALKLDVSAPPSTPTFSDVPTSSYAYAYVEAAAKAGLIHGTGNGVFGYGQNLTREQLAVMLVNALGVNATGDASNLNFTDNSAITYGKDAVGYAVKVGLLHGNPDGSFNPAGNATREQVALVTSSFLKIKSGQGTLAITPASTNLAVGQKQQFSVSGTSDAVTWSVTGNGVIDQQGNFVGTAAGTATVTATVDGQTLTQAVSVYGQVTSLKFSTPKDIVANGASSQIITVQAVDANGNPVPNFNGSATFTFPTGGSEGAAKYVSAAAVSPTFDATTTNIGALTFVNGQAQFQVVSGHVAGLTDTVEISNLVDTNNVAVPNYTAVTTTYTTVAQVATTITLSASSSVSVNTPTQSPVTIEVDDQSGQPMSSGVYGLNVHIAGVAQYSDGTTADKSITFVGGQTDPQVTLQSVQGVVGSTTITVSATGLTSGTATIQSVVAGTAAKLSVSNTSSTTNDFMTGSAGQQYDVSTVDASGNDTGEYLGNGLRVYVTNANGTPATGITVNGVPMMSDGTGVLIGAHAFTIADIASDATAGKYSVVVKDTATTGALSTSNAFTFNVTPDTISEPALSLSTANNYLAAANPTTAVTVQVTDKYGNALETAGIPVTLMATTTSSAEAAFNNGAQVTAPTATVYTTANGTATANFTSQAYDGTTWTLSASAGTSYTAATPVPVSVKYSVTSALSASATAATNMSSQVTAGTPIAFSITQEDAYGNAVTGEDDNVTVTLSNANAIVWPTATSAVSVDTNAGTVSGPVSAVVGYLNGATAKQAGNVSFTVKDTSVNASSGTAAVNVVPNTQNGFAFFDASGKEITTTNELSATANVPASLTLKPVDMEGNPVVSNEAYTVYLSDNGGGQFQTVAGGSSVTSVTFAAGSGSQAIYYVNPSTGNAYLPTADSYTAATSEGTTSLTSAGTSVAAASSDLTFTVQPKDNLGHAVTGLGANAFAVTSNSVGNVPIVSVQENPAGTYTVTATDTKASANPQTFTVSVNGNVMTAAVAQTATITAGTATSIVVTPATKTVAQSTGGNVNYTAVVKDAFGNVSPDTVTWSIATNTDATPVTIDPSTGVLTVASTTTKDTYTVTATDNTVTGTATVTVN